MISLFICKIRRHKKSDYCLYTKKVCDLVFQTKVSWHANFVGTWQPYFMMLAHLCVTKGCSHLPVANDGNLI